MNDICKNLLNKKNAIFLLFVISLIILPMSYSKYLGKAFGSGNIDSAVPIIEYSEEGTKPITFYLDELDGVTTRSYNFRVQNFNTNHEVSEVMLSYSIHVTTTNNIALNFTLMNSSDSEDIVFTFSGDGTSDFYEISSDFIYGLEEYDDYILTVKMKEENNNYLYQDLCDIITIDVHWKQNID